MEQRVQISSNVDWYFSKYGWIVPLKNKKGDTVAEALKNVLKERILNFLWTDKGKVQNVTEMWMKSWNSMVLNNI